MTENKIGQEGETLNLSFSTRSMNIEPDVEHLKQFDEYPSKKPLLSYVFYLLSLSLLVWSIYLFSKGSWVLGIAVAILSLIFIACDGSRFHNDRGRQTEIIMVSV